MNNSEEAYINKIDNIPKRDYFRLPLKGVTRTIEKTKKHRNLEPPSRVNSDGAIYVDNQTAEDTISAYNNEHLSYVADIICMCMKMEVIFNPNGSLPFLYAPILIEKEAAEYRRLAMVDDETYSKIINSTFRTDDLMSDWTITGDNDDLISKWTITGDNDDFCNAVVDMFYKIINIHINPKNAIIQMIDATKLYFLCSYRLYKYKHVLPPGNNMYDNYYGRLVEYMWHTMFHSFASSVALLIDIKKYDTVIKNRDILYNLVKNADDVAISNTSAQIKIADKIELNIESWKNSNNTINDAVTNMFASVYFLIDDKVYIYFDRLKPVSMLFSYLDDIDSRIGGDMYSLTPDKFTIIECKYWKNTDQNQYPPTVFQRAYRAIYQAYLYMNQYKRYSSYNRRKHECMILLNLYNDMTYTNSYVCNIDYSNICPPRSLTNYMFMNYKSFASINEIRNQDISTSCNDKPNNDPKIIRILGQDMQEQKYQRKRNRLS